MALSDACVTVFIFYSVFILDYLQLEVADRDVSNKSSSKDMGDEIN